MDDKIELLDIQKVSNGYIVTLNNHRGLSPVAIQSSENTLVFNTADQLCDYIKKDFKV